MSVKNNVRNGDAFLLKEKSKFVLEENDCSGVRMEKRTKPKQIQQGAKSS